MLRGHDLARQRDVALCRADDLAVLVSISILFVGSHVKRSDDISLPVVDIFVVRDQLIRRIHPFFGTICPAEL